MTANLLVYGQMLRTTLAATTGQLQNRIDGLLKAEGVPAGQSQQSGLPVWAIVLIVVGVVICLIALCVVAVFAVLFLMTPSVGNVFSSIENGI
jgi:phage shock protein PspC (stress-responsive transcriptional regulator)